MGWANLPLVPLQVELHRRLQAFRVLFPGAGQAAFLMGHDPQGRTTPCICTASAGTTCLKNLWGSYPSEERLSQDSRAQHPACCDHAVFSSFPFISLARPACRHPQGEYCPVWLSSSHFSSAQEPGAASSCLDILAAALTPVRG